MKTYYIYKYTNTVNNKIYIGQCFNIKSRKKSHKSSAKINSDSCPLFYRAIRAHGYDSFTFEIIEEIYTDQAGIDEREIFWIKELDARNAEVGYNLAKGGSGRGGINNTDTHKQCPRCGEIKLRETEYTKNASAHDGIRFCCRECGLKIDREQRELLSEEEMEIKNKIRREKYAANPQLYIESAKKYSAAHKEERKVYIKEYAENNAESLKEYNKNYRIEHKEELANLDRNIRNNFKEENQKLTPEQICTRTPTKICAMCKTDVPSKNFYIDVTREDGLARNCKTCHKAKMAINREKNRSKAKISDNSGNIS